MTDPVALSRHVEEAVEFPDTLANWLGRLKLLYGVPIHYLVPDEGMLPPESIRFFYLDDNWINALVDGAFSIGRNLTDSDDITPAIAQDVATTPVVNSTAVSAASGIRAAGLGVASKVSVAFNTVSGFLLRSALVQNYPGLGVNPYPAGGTPDQDDPTKINLLNILRMERLGPGSDTLICLVEGDVYRVDIHEAPEALHYGVDSFQWKDQKMESLKTIYRFEKDEKSDKRHPRVIMDMKNPLKIDIARNNCFRTNSDPRTLKMRTLAGVIAQNQKTARTTIDAAEMGFEMVEGVGMVSFYRK